MTEATAITIGNFDGVHVGHRRLLEAARAKLDEAGGGRVVAVTFDPHPAEIVRPEVRVPRLDRMVTRLERLRAAGADDVVVVEATADRLRATPEEFLDWVVDVLQPTWIVEGPDFRFGRNRAGSVELLRAAADRLGYLPVIVPHAEVALTDLHVVRASSSRARWLIERGRMRDAAIILGRPYELSGPVVRGDQRGRTLGIPTANIDHGPMLLPADGIYAGRAVLPDGTTRTAAISVGTKPTFGASPRLCEAHLLDHERPCDDYGWDIRLEIHAWLRAQVRYDDVPSLMAQLGRDLVAVRHRMERADGSPRRSIGTGVSV